MSEILLKQGFKPMTINDKEFFYKEIPAEQALDIVYFITQKASVILPGLSLDQELDLQAIGTLLSNLTKGLSSLELKDFLKNVWKSANVLYNNRLLTFDSIKTSELVTVIKLTIEILKEELAPFFQELQEIIPK